MSCECRQGSDPKVVSILADYPHIAAAWLFGSVACGTAIAGSDVDIGILLKNRQGHVSDHYLWLGDLANRLEQFYHRNVDLVILGPQGAVFCHRILREGTLIYDAAPERRIDFESTTYSRYFDFRPTWQIATRVITQGLLDWLDKRS